ncbi:hypothetical protein [Bradyrhizobium diversitatis]|uniref:Uncharacterized protein n=1 Tax=Bradyrhizobium diversitatis TaxID=2755406 RepID=A0ABS0NXK9_9BRAD|nr:hypothetical protein [Bradyrhizobium diversitatis]MBH5385747.1 hypothetical protein [Bradyrhizobium diversitatis]
MSRKRSAAYAGGLWCGAATVEQMKLAMKRLSTPTIAPVLLFASLAELPGGASAACNGCKINVPDGSLPARTHGEAVGGAIVVPAASLAT